MKKKKWKMRFDKFTFRLPLTISSLMSAAFVGEKAPGKEVIDICDNFVNS